MNRVAWLPAILLVSAVLLLTNCASLRQADATTDTPGEMVSFHTQAEDGEQPATIYVPANYHDDRQWPLIVFLHGMGERGADGIAQTEVGIGPAIIEHPERFPALVLMPQCSADYVWTSPIGMAHIDNAIAQVRERYNVDEERIYLTGLSMGGYGAFNYGALHPELFAAVVPICGGGNPERHAAPLATIPMWVFHGGADTVVVPERSRQMVEAIRDAGGNIQYTEYPGVGHNAWDVTYGDAKVIEWMLAQRKSN